MEEQKELDEKEKKLQERLEKIHSMEQEVLKKEKKNNDIYKERGFYMKKRKR